MASVHHVAVKDGDVLLLVGTTKGAFLVRSGGARRGWEVGGPHFAGQAVYTMAFDGRAGRHRLWASAHSMHWGAVLHASDDFGRTWTNPEAAPIRLPEAADGSEVSILPAVSGGAPGWRGPGRRGAAGELDSGRRPAVGVERRPAAHAARPIAGPPHGVPEAWARVPRRMRWRR